MRIPALALLVAQPLTLALSLSPAAAQTASPPPAETAPQSPSLFEEGARMMLRGLIQEMQPTLDDMGKALTGIEPALRDMARLIDDIRNYDAPRMLPNGDILIPRRPGAPPPPTTPRKPPAPETGEIEL